jgi:uncharacterized lipoprotein
MRIATLGIATLWVCLLAGCSVGPDYKRPRAEAQYREALALVIAWLTRGYPG